MIKQDASYIYMTYTSCHLRAVCNKTHTGTVVHLEVKGPRELLSRREVRVSRRNVLCRTWIVRFAPLKDNEAFTRSDV